jgi:hypothetical protein
MRESLAQRQVETHLRRALSGTSSACITSRSSIRKRKAGRSGPAALEQSQARLYSAGPVHTDRRRDRVDRTHREMGIARSPNETAAWQKAGYPLKGVSVNVSAVQFSRSDFVSTVDEVLKATGLAPRFLPQVLGRRATRPIKRGERIHWDVMS